ncbi:MAG TPA: acyl-CoA dehydrogenase [Sandaracinaceae bacterium LLY-WYZ-13_1]|nr:acyl-CoA dehydrogenase [Sandaracinaceae bacterium LLY-WYZ-13_1]
MSHPLIDDRLVDLLLRDVVDAPSLTRLDAFADHDAETFDLYLASCRRLARDVLFDAYRPMDEAPPVLEDGRVRLHPSMRAIYSQLVELGVVAATRPFDVGGQQLPLTVATLAHAYLMAANLSATGIAWLTTGAAHLIEAFGDEATRERFLAPMYEGRWTGTMALTEPQAGSSLADLTTTATPADDGTYRIRGAKIFISGADHDVAENVVNLTLARIEGAPQGTKGVSLFAVPRLRPEGDGLVGNDVHVTGLIHKIGWRGLPSLALSFGDEGHCVGWLVGAPHEGLKQMFQMMNEARIMVGVNAAATASVAYHESLAYARERKQGRPVGQRGGAPVPLVAHADVRRMLLRQKAIVDGSLCLCAVTARLQDLAHHGDAGERERAQLLLDLLTPVTKSFPAERGFEANTLSIQVLGGYGYTSEYLPEAWWRDQKLNSIHEGTTGIQGLDLLGRKVVAKGGAALRAFGDAVGGDVAAAREAGVAAERCDALEAAIQRVAGLTVTLGQRGLAGDVDGMLAHSADYLELFSILVVAWMHLKLETAVADRDDDFARGLRHAARYWIATELPRIAHLAQLCEDAEDSYASMDPAWF